MQTNVASKAKSKGFDFSELEENINAMISPVTVKDLSIFARQFAAMFNAGVPMVRCLAVLHEQCPNAKLKKALGQINLDVQQGNELSESMRKHPDCFSSLFVSMTAAGEVGGVLDEVLNRLALMLEKNVKIQNEVNSAMAYPKTVGGIAILVFFGMTTFLLPTFAGIFEQVGADLPAFTLFMLAISKFCRTFPLNILSVFAVIGLFFAYQQYYKTPSGQLVMDRIFLKLPIVSDIVQKTAVARFCNIFGSLTRSGVPIMNALEIVADTAGNKVISNAIDFVRTEIQQGGQISVALKEEGVFPNLAIQMIAIGEETGELDKMLMKVGEFYEDEAEQALKGLTSMLEPLMMVGVACIVGAVLLSMYLPMFKMFDKLG